MTQPDYADPTRDTLPDYEAIRVDDDGPLCWLFTGTHIGVAPEFPAVNAPGGES